MYVVIELQSNSDGTIGNIVTSYDNEQEAAAKYHQILSAGAISNIYKHSAFMLNDDGWCMKSECYKHEVSE